MHSGYPLMAHLDQQAQLEMNAEHLYARNVTGAGYHEVGHNHQVAVDWTFDEARSR